MKKVICLSGISGSGKTYRRTTDPALKDLPALDIYDVYKAHHGVGPRIAFNIFMGKIVDAMEENDAIVVEAWFRKGSFQRDWIGYVAERNGWELEYIEIEATVEECVERIKKQAEETAKEIKNEDDLKEWREFIDTRLRLLALV